MTNNENKIVSKLKPKQLQFLIFLVIFIDLFITIDQVSKYYVRTNFEYGESVVVIKDFFHFTYSQNQGAAFSMGDDYPIEVRRVLFLFIPVIAVLWLIYLMYKSIPLSFFKAFSYALIVSGAIGNLIDRFYLGYVVDFFHFFYRDYHFAIFNVADSLISVAAFLLILDLIIEQIRAKKKLTT